MLRVTQSYSSIKKLTDIESIVLLIVCAFYMRLIRYLGFDYYEVYYIFYQITFWIIIAITVNKNMNIPGPWIESELQL